MGVSNQDGEAPVGRSRDDRAPTILDLAAVAGVSKTTVSRVLNGSPRVAPETRARVLDAVTKLSFQVNHAARSLRTSRTGLVGFLVPVISVFGLIVESLDRDLAEDGLSILLTSSRRRDTARDREAIEMLVGRGVDGLVLAPSDDRDPLLSRTLKTVRAPIVLLDREVRGVSADAVYVDQGPGINAAMSFLSQEGRERIALLTRDRKTRPGRQIIACYEAAARRLGCQIEADRITEFEDLDREAGRDGVDRLLAAGADAIIATGTMEHTASILERLGEHGIRVPNDLALVVYGHLGPSMSGYTVLPTIAYPVDEVARATRRLLLPRLNGLASPPRIELVGNTFIKPEVGTTTFA